MASRVLMGSAALGGVLLVWSVVSQRSMVAKIDGLTDRIALLEERSGAVGIRRAGRVDGADSRAVFRGKSKGRRVRPAAAASEDTGSAPPVAGSAELTEIPDSLRDELVQIVEDEQEIASENRREEWRTRMREGMRDSVEEFVDDRGISDDVAEQMRRVSLRSNTWCSNTVCAITSSAIPGAYTSTRGRRANTSTRGRTTNTSTRGRRANDGDRTSKPAEPAAAAPAAIF